MSLPVTRPESRSRGSQQRGPFQELEELQERALQMLQNTLGADPVADGARIWVPLADIEETDDAWIVEAEIPGVKRDDVDIEVHDNELQISGTIEERERKGIMRRRARRTGRFEYRVTLPGRVDADSIDASLKHGVLTLRVPKPQEARPQRVEIKSSQEE
ncbi:MAG TPA: Hsp20/alpha crystallin family protein [Solirubrobacteraceae bacterium]|jgi:HSP20 family protein|nr:Hsp20/alpha crystallin family protein [Solirubrobacteraceae bacterium]